VGAGFAGMRTALVLRAAGVDAVVIEAGRRPGGRVRTIRDPFVEGQCAESGAEWVDSHHHRMAELLDRYDVDTLGEGEQWTTIRRWLHVDGQLLDPAALLARDPSLFDQLEKFDLIVAAAAEGVDPAHPCNHAGAAAVDARSLADVADEAELTGLARLFKWRDTQGEYAAEPEEVSLLFMAQQRAYHPRSVVRAFRVDGGFSQIAVAMAAELGDAINFGEALLGVEQDADGVTVRTTERELRADHAVLACSLVPLRDVRVDWPDPLGAAVHGLGYGTVTKTAVQWPRRRWPSGYATTAGRGQRVYEPTKDQSGDTGILMTYCGGRGGHEWAALDDAARRQLAIDEMRSMHGLTDEPLGGFSRAWSTAPRFGGSYALYRPGEMTAFWEVLRAPWGRVHLAGEHVATCTGYMEGALESGDTVATRLLDGR